MKPLPSDRLLFGLQEPLAYLYHYTSGETFADYIVQSMKLMLNTIDRMNDPRECDRWEFDWLGSEGDTFLLGSDRLNDDIRAKARLCCFCRDEDMPQGELSHFEVVYARGFSRPRMWAQYAGNHSGVCLILDRQKLLVNFESYVTEHLQTLLFGRVDYTNRMPIGRLGRVDAFTIIDREYRAIGPEQYALYHVIKHQRELFFRKQLDWRDENEYRILLFGTFLGEVLISISGALKHVVLGAKCSAVTREKIIKTCCEKKIDASTLTWKNGYPQPLPLVWNGQQLFK